MKTDPEYDLNPPQPNCVALFFIAIVCWLFVAVAGAASRLQRLLK